MLPDIRLLKIGEGLDSFTWNYVILIKSAQES